MFFFRSLKKKAKQKNEGQNSDVYTKIGSDESQRSDGSDEGQRSDESDEGQRSDGSEKELNNDEVNSLHEDGNDEERDIQNEVRVNRTYTERIIFSFSSDDKDSLKQSCDRYEDITEKEKMIKKEMILKLTEEMKGIEQDMKKLKIELEETREVKAKNSENIKEIRKEIRLKDTEIKEIKSQRKKITSLIERTKKIEELRIKLSEAYSLAEKIEEKLLDKPEIDDEMLEQYKISKEEYEKAFILAKSEKEVLMKKLEEEQIIKADLTKKLRESSIKFSAIEDNYVDREIQEFKSKYGVSDGMDDELIKESKKKMVDEDCSLDKFKKRYVEKMDEIRDELTCLMADLH